MSIYLPDIAWRTILKEVTIVEGNPFHYKVEVSPLDPNEPGADPMLIDTECWVVDYAGYTYQVTYVDVNVLTIYDVNERVWGTNYIGPTPNMEAYIYKPKNGAFLLTQAQLRYLDRSAADKIYPVEKGVAWAHRGVKLCKDGSAVENVTELELDGISMESQGAGWQGGLRYKLKASGVSGNVQSEYLVREVTQISHGFDKDFVYYSSGSWKKAIAISADSCATHLALKVDNDNFELVTVGELTIADYKDDENNSLVSGEYYFLSKTVAGKVSRDKPEEALVQSLLKVNSANNITISIQEPYEEGIDFDLPAHNSLAGLNAGNYQHLTSGEKTNFGLLVGGTDITNTLHNHNSIYESKLSFSNSLSRVADAISLVNDSTTPGNLKYYGTNASGVKGYYSIPNPLLKTIAGNSLFGNGNIMTIFVSSTEPSTAGKLDGDIWVEE